MLSSLLPGLRDLRTPLAVGYLWLVALWLILHRWVPKSVEEAQAGPIKALYQLWSLLGSPVALAAISFIAYLLGTMPRFQLYRRLGTVLSLRGLWRVLPSFVRKNRLRELQFSMSGQLFTFASGRLREASLSLEEHARVAQQARIVSDFHDQGGELSQASLTRLYSDAIIEELDAVGIQLQAKNRDFWDTYDRHLAEAQFRYGIAPPLALIICLLAFQSGDWWWLLLLLIPMTLVVLGVQHSYQAVATLVQAVVLRMVNPPVMERLDEAVAKSEEAERRQRQVRRDRITQRAGRRLRARPGA